jgi:hypothetical protein
VRRLLPVVVPVASLALLAAAPSRGALPPAQVSPRAVGALSHSPAYEAAYTLCFEQAEKAPAAEVRRASSYVPFGSTAIETRATTVGCAAGEAAAGVRPFGTPVRHTSGTSRD